MSKTWRNGKEKYYFSRFQINNENNNLCKGKKYECRGNTCPEVTHLFLINKRIP